MLLPVYEADFDPLLDKYDGISVVSLVKYPAIESDFVKLSQTNKFERTYFDKKKKVICGAVLIPDKLIYRNNGVEEFFIKFSADSISKLHKAMMKSGTFGNFSLEHNGNILIRELYPTEVWVKEFDQDKSNAYGLNLPIGTLLMSAKIEDDLLWDKIEEGEFNGFSIEAFLNYKYTNMEKFLFEKIELGAQIIKQLGDAVEWKFSGEFENDGRKILVEDGLVKEIKPIALEEEKPTVEPVEEPASISELLEKIEQFSAEFEAIRAEIAEVKTELSKEPTTETVSKDEFQNLLNKVEEVKLASVQTNTQVIEIEEPAKTSRLDIIEKFGKVNY